jgi:hypothetical protein
MSILKMLNNDNFNIFFSILLGIGIICIIKPVCSGPNCSINKPPISNDFDKYVYKMGKKCYEFTPEVIDCPKSGETVEAFKQCNAINANNIKSNTTAYIEPYEGDNFARRKTIIKRCE